jgi:hypothetical protein
LTTFVEFDCDTNQTKLSRNGSNVTVLEPFPLVRPSFFRCSAVSQHIRIAMGFDNVWNARKGPRAEGKVDPTGKGKPINGKGTRECR